MLDMAMCLRLLHHCTNSSKGRAHLYTCAEARQLRLVAYFTMWIEMGWCRGTAYRVAKAWHHWAWVTQVPRLLEDIWTPFWYIWIYLVFLCSCLPCIQQRNSHILTIIKWLTATRTQNPDWSTPLYCVVTTYQLSPITIGQLRCIYKAS